MAPISAQFVGVAEIKHLCVFSFSLVLRLHMHHDPCKMLAGGTLLTPVVFDYFMVEVNSTGFPSSLGLRVIIWTAF